jgi:hypothetical protein
MRSRSISRKIPRMDGFRDVALHAAGQTALLVALHGVGGQRMMSE